MFDEKSQLVASEAFVKAFCGQGRQTRIDTSCQNSIVIKNLVEKRPLITPLWESKDTT